MSVRVPGRLAGLALATGLLTLAGAARAAPGYVTDGVNLRAGPGVDYPLVTPLPPGTPAEIYGCLPGWTWCDIAVNGPQGGVRGWAAGPRLQLAYNGQPVELPEYGPQFGLPIIGFDVDNYWGTYYRAEPWFGDRGRWRGDFHGGGQGFDRARGDVGRGDVGRGEEGPRGPGDFAGDPRGGFPNRGPGGEPGGFHPGGGPGGRPGGEQGGFRPGGGPRPGGPGPGGSGHPGPAPGPQGHPENHGGGGGVDHRGEPPH